MRLFDSLLRGADPDTDVYSLVLENAQQRDALIDAFGCFPAAVLPLVESSDSAQAFFERHGPETPQSGVEWLMRFPPPPVTPETPPSLFADWRRQTIARIALDLAARATPFDAAAEAMHEMHLRSIAGLFDLARATASEKEADAGEKIALHVFESAGPHLPGAATHLGFIASGKLGESGEAFTRRYLNMLDDMGDGLFALAPDISHRPQGVSGQLAPDLKSFKTYVQSEAVAYDQIMLARARVIAGEKKIADKAKSALRAAAL